MMNTPHVLTGAAIGVATGNPILGFIGGVASHFFLDAIPHTDPGTWHFEEPLPFKIDERDLTAGFLDLVIAAGLLVWLAGKSPIVAVAPLVAMFGAILPDIFVVMFLFWPKLVTLPIFKQYDALNRILQARSTAAPKQWLFGIATQVVITGISVWYLLRVS